MPDQLPSAILDSNNSFDSLFALELDTKQRFDNILSGLQNPIDYPIPDFNKDFYPNGLPQEDLLDPIKTKGTLGEALFSPDLKVAQYATDKMRSMQANLPVNRGVGAPDRFSYDKMMNKYLNSDFGYNPYMSIEDNEDFNYRYDYQNKTAVGKILSTVGHGLTRFVGSVLLKLGQTIGYMGSMVGEGIQELIELGGGPENNFMADVADNSLSRWFEKQEQNMKDSHWLQVFKPKGWEDMGFFKKLGYGAFWSDEVADGAAFMGEMIASMYLLGGLGKIGAIGKFGETSIDLAGHLSKYGKFAQGIGKGTDFLTKLATGADDIQGIGRWAFSVTSEAAFEASDGYTRSVETLKAERDAGKNTYSDAEIRKISGDRAAARFKANLLILSASSAFENKFIFSPLFKKGSLQAASGGQRGRTLSRLIGISDDASSLETLAQASRKEYKYSTWLGKKLDWKNSNSRLRFYGGRGLSAVAAEGFWEENAQLAAERLSAQDNLSLNTFIHKLGKQTLEALKGFLPWTESTDPEAETNIGLGGLIGIGGVSFGAKMQKGYKTVKDKDGKEVVKPIYLRGERRNTEDDVLKAINAYETYRRKFLNFNDIYVTDDTGKPVMDEGGNMQIDESKALGLMDGMNQFASKQAAIEKTHDPLLKKHLQDEAMLDFVMAAKNAGIFNRSLEKFSNLGSLDGEQLKKLGFDPSTIVDVDWMKQSLIDAGKIYEEVYNGVQPRMKKGDTKEDNENRKFNLYKTKGRVVSAKKIAEEYRKAMTDVNYPSAFSPEAEDQDIVLQEFNARIYQRRSHEQISELHAENGDFFKKHDETQSKELDKEMDELLQSLLPKIMAGSLVPTFEGFLMSRARYDKLFPNKPSYFNPSAISSEFLKVEELIDALGEPVKTGTSSQERVKPKKYLTLEDLGYSEEKFNKATGTESTKREARFLFDMESSAQAKYAEMRNVAARNQYLADKLDSIPEGMTNWKAYKAYSDNIQKKDAEADDKTPPQAAPTTPETNVPTGQPAALPPAVTPKQGEPTSVKEEKKTEPLSGKEVINNQQLITDLTKSITKLVQQHLAWTEGESPNYGELANLISTFYKSSPKEIQAVFQKEILDKYLTPVKTKIDNNTLTENKKDSEEVETLGKVEQFIYEVFNEGVPDEFDEWISAPFEAITKQLNNYDFVDKTEFTPEEQKAIDEVNKLDLSNTGLRYYGEVLKSEKSTPEEIKDALKGISDQLLAPSTALQAGDALGQTASLAIEALGHPAPVENPKLEEIQKGSASLQPQVAVKMAMVKPLAELRKELIDLKRRKAEGSKDPGLDAQIDEWEKEIALQEKLGKGENEGRLEGQEEIIPPTIPPAKPPSPPKPPIQAAENSDSESKDSENWLDVKLDEAKRQGLLSFVQNLPEEILLGKNGLPVIADGAIQLKTTEGPQQEQALRQHRVLEKMGSRSSAVNFWSEDNEGKPLFRVKLLYGTDKNKDKYEKWVYRTDLGKTNAKGEPFEFPFIFAVITDQKGNPVYFNLQGEITDKTNGQPVGFPFSATEYASYNLGKSRRGIMTRSGESLNGVHGFENDNPLGDMNAAVLAGIPVFGDIDEVTSGRLGTADVTNSPSATHKAEYTHRTVKQVIESGDVSNDAVVVLKEGEVFEYSYTAEGTQQQQIKVGQPYLLDRSGLYIPLKGNTIRNLTYNGKPLLDGILKDSLEGLQKDGYIEIDMENTSPQQQVEFQALFTFLRAIFYSQDIFISQNPEGSKIFYTDNRSVHLPLLDTELNFSTNITALGKPFTEDTIIYSDFVAENFTSGVIPAEVEKGKKEVAKLNKRITFTLDMNHPQLIEALEAKGVTPTVRVKSTNMESFVGKTYSRRGSSAMVTVTSFKDGVFTIKGEKGEVTQSQEDFMKSLRKLHEVKVPAASEEVNDEFTNRQKLSKEDIKDLLEKSKTDSVDNLKNETNLGCD